MAQLGVAAAGPSTSSRPHSLQPSPIPHSTGQDLTIAPPRALLVVPTSSLTHVRPAGLDLIQRMTKRTRALAARAARRAANNKTGDLLAPPSRSTFRPPPVELHVLLLAKPDGTAQDVEDTRRALMMAFNSAGASAFIHSAAATGAGNRMSVLAGFAKSKINVDGVTRAKLEAALAEGTALASQLGLDDEAERAQSDSTPPLAEVGFVFPEANNSPDETESSKGFIEVVAKRFGGKTPVTIYLAPNEIAGEFDADEKEPRAVRVAQAAADRLTTSLLEQAPQATEEPFSVSQLQREGSKRWSAADSFGSIRGQSSSMLGVPSSSSRRHSFQHQTSGSLLDQPTVNSSNSNSVSNYQSAHSQIMKPLLLRPAPGPGAQSLSLRLALPGVGQDIVLRVAEAISPIEEVRPTRHRAWGRGYGFASSDASSSIGDEPQPETNKRSSLLLPILGRAPTISRGSRSPSACSATSFESQRSSRAERFSFGSSTSTTEEVETPLTPHTSRDSASSSPPQLHLSIPATPDLGHTDEASLPSSPESSPSTPPTRGSFQPPQRNSTAKRQPSEAEWSFGVRDEAATPSTASEDHQDAGDLTPVWDEVRNLLKNRVEQPLIGGRRPRGVGGLPVRVSRD